MTVTTASGSGSGKDPAAAPAAPNTTDFEATPGRFGGVGPLGESRSPPGA